MKVDVTKSFAAKPEIATRHEAEIAAAMHKRLGQKGRLPITTYAQTAESAEEYRDKYRDLMNNAPGEWMSTKSVAFLWGLEVGSASNVLRRMREKGVIDTRVVRGNRQWRAARE